jgi:integrase
MSEPSMVSLAEEYLALRRRLGFSLEVEGSQLLAFARYAEQMEHEGPITTELAVAWARLPERASPLCWARRLDIVRRFALYRIATDPHTEIPPPGLLGASYRRTEPHIYSDDEIAALLGAAARLRSKGGLRPHTYTTLFGLLASTGLRISEALHLDRADVDLRTGVLTITETKFRKSRLVPLHPSTVTALKAYVERRDHSLPLKRTGRFFISDYAARLNYPTVCSTFVKLRRDLGWVNRSGRRLPRIHDLRHAFACRRLLAWYRDGADIPQKMLALSTYLGHVSVEGTYWYLTAVPDLMAIASSRFERRRGT